MESLTMRVIQVKTKTDVNGKKYYSAKIHRVRAKKYSHDYEYSVEENFERTAQLYLAHLETVSGTWGKLKIKDHGLLNEETEIFTLESNW